MIGAGTGLQPVSERFGFAMTDKTLWTGLQTPSSTINGYFVNVILDDQVFEDNHKRLLKHTTL
jgi:hypothetical protein